MISKNKLAIILYCIIFFTSININAQSGGKNLFDNVTHSIYITFTQVNFWSLLQSNKAYDDAKDSSTYIPVKVTIDGKLIDSVGIQFKGNSSYYNYPSNKKHTYLKTICFYATNDFVVNKLYSKIIKL